MTEFINGVTCPCRLMGEICLVGLEIDLGAKPIRERREDIVARIWTHLNK
jgi:hypothetical protein